MNKKKLLVLTPRFPYPVVGGDRLRIYYICKQLSEKYDITLLSFCETKYELNMPAPKDGVFMKIERVYLPKWKSYLKVLKALLSSTPLQIAYYESQEFSIKVDELLTDSDLALAHLVRVSNYLKGKSLPCILEMTDAISMNYERVQRIATLSGVKNIIYSLEQNRLKQFEKSIVRFFNMSVLISNIDRDYLFDESVAKANNVIVCSNGVELTNYPFSQVSDLKKLVFIGNMNSLQNFDAAYWFASRVLPKLNEDGSGFEFLVIGRISSSNKKRLSRLSNVSVTGPVGNVSEYAMGALAGICSMRLGAGVQNKVLEYMALGLPSVISPVAAEGINGTDEEHFFVANSINDYVEIIKRLNQDLTIATEMASSARHMIESEYSWSKVLRHYNKQVDSLVIE
ncbi:glycosyltransferase family 4 protein [Saccharospirillum impatiens]|uniref:glycosyltransferase family 4 protein n=1 Tax=Saccharospirillum impatiens TaxID=169438 RepID=UPI0004042842|nr:glycosyltransferase family 4 protein [Saccharospirillum impatiens]